MVFSLCHRVVEFSTSPSHHYVDQTKWALEAATPVTAKAGDVLMFSGPIQHCAMPNRSKGFRTGILQHMAPVYIK